ncbi:rhodanese-like domain-containing protein [Seongchinamella sediminis]|uniref:Rhodanese-like domain-containing protein n=1 Tax=Seongchinamella sediminis TaxID=2283635 RepID=A0A3L7E0L2_9GAMM|nr:rhodanese-like domain-containing protein [Seongchinamella sediminis]RLQ23318.1 rhodanese-like domain-containing protein [Seongchinamella sediminis]
MLKTVPELVAEARTDLRCVDAATATAEVNENQGTIVDVRELIEVENLNAPHSLNIPRGILEMKITELVPDENHPIYLHCATGGRATLAAEQLKRMGYRKVTVITCPIDTVMEQQKLLSLG